MNVQTFSNPNMLHRAWLVKPYKVNKAEGGIHSIGVYIRMGWKYWNLQVTL